jgi:hypothetical protein
MAPGTGLLGGGDDAEVLEAVFVEGFRAAGDRHAFLHLAGIPFTLNDGTGNGALKLVGVVIEDAFSVGAVGRGFASNELSHQPLPGPLIRKSTRLLFRYVSAEAVREVTLAEIRDG